MQRPFGALFLIFFSFSCKKGVLKYVPVFLRFLGHPERSTGRAHMQSVRACAVQTHFSVFEVRLKKRFLKSAISVNFGAIFAAKFELYVKKRASKNASKKGARPDSN